MDVWGFGLVMFQLLSERTQPQRLHADPETIATWDSSGVKEQLLGLSSAQCCIADHEARDLLNWCLQTNPARRPRSFSDVRARSLARSLPLSLSLSPTLSLSLSLSPSDCV